MNINTFIESITHLPFQEVIRECSTDEKIHLYCNDSRYNNNWKRLIDVTFGNMYGYEDALNKLWKKNNIEPETFNYIVYTQLIKLLDPVTQGIIYYNQGDMKTFELFSKNLKFIALFLLGHNDKLKKYLPSNDYLPFIDISNGYKITQHQMNSMLTKVARIGSVQGIRYFINSGADIHYGDDISLISASELGYLEAVKYLIEQGANIHAQDDFALKLASLNGKLEVVKYLVEQGANIDDRALNFAISSGNLKVVDYLKEHMRIR